MTDRTEVHCRACGAEIPALSATCPACGVDRSDLDGGETA